jgi:hypothetical protein
MDESELESCKDAIINMSEVLYEIVNKLDSYGKEILKINESLTKIQKGMRDTSLNNKLMNNKNEENKPDDDNKNEDEESDKNPEKDEKIKVNINKDEKVIKDNIKNVENKIVKEDVKVPTNKMRRRKNR